MGKVRIHYGNVATLRDGLRQALYKTADAIRTDVRDKQVIPFDKGTLQENTFIDDTRNPDNAYVVSSTPYARRLYFHPEYNFRTENNEHAGGKWFEPRTSKGKYAGWVKRRFESFVKECADV
nr:MAG TPA: Minor capsid protein [Caudoviricetes sp.]